MRNYYDVLEVERTADAAEIKRAYFRQVKKYVPERFPEEFKEIRAAYETLYDEKRRAEYDRDTAMPEDAAWLYNLYKKLRGQGLLRQANETIEELAEKYPVPEYRVELARSLSEEGKSGKASEVWAELCAADPVNTDYIVGLANAYRNRGWRKKAIAECERAIDIDPGNGDAWESMIKCHVEREDKAKGYELCVQGIETLKKRGKEKAGLYFYAILHSLKENYDCAPYFENVLRMFQEDPEILSDFGEDGVNMMLSSVMRNRRSRFLPYIERMAGMLPEISGEFRKELDAAALYCGLFEISDEGCSDVFHDIFVILIEQTGFRIVDEDEEDEEDFRKEMVYMELEILSKIASYRSELLHIREKYPRLYALHADFFNEILRTREVEKLVHQRLNIIRNDEEYYAVQPQARRAEPKIGRNDPCPCGSGKKYKKCCGA